MGTVIIGGGDHARAALAQLESDSVNHCDDWRTRAENLVKQFTSDCSALCAEEE